MTEADKKGLFSAAIGGQIPRKTACATLNGNRERAGDGSAN